jgi:hypothetical protein
MPAETELVTVYRSADDSAEEDGEAIRELLVAQGITAVVLGDTEPGVPEGAWEVRVPPADAARAEDLIATAPLPEGELVEADDSSALDMETVFSAGGGTTAELEAMSIKSVLESSGVAAMIVGDSVLPNLAFEVRVAREHAERARELILEAQAAGPSAADEAERDGELP